MIPDAILRRRSLTSAGKADKYQGVTRTLHSLYLIPAFVLGLASPPLLDAAGVYKRELPDGSVIYSDQPHPDASPVQAHEPQVIAPFKPTAGSAASSPARSGDSRGEPPPAYARLEIIAPGDDEVVWNNDRLLEVAVTTAPAIRSRNGHRLSILIDGEVVAHSANETRFLVENVFRGTHVLEAAVENAGGEIIQRSAPVTFHMRQHSILSPTRP